MCQSQLHAEALLNPRAPTGARRRAATVLRVVAVLLVVAGWACAITSTVIANTNGNGYSSLKHYSWTGVTFDAAVAAVVACALATLALCARAPAAALVIGVGAGVLLAVKLGMLHAAGSSDVQVAALAAAAPWCLAIGAVFVRRLARGAKTGLSDAAGSVNAATDLESSGAEKPKEPKKPRGATVGRLLAQARPEAPLLVLATCALFLSTASQMAMPHFIGVLIGSVANDDTQYAAHCQASAHALLECKKQRLQQVAELLVTIFTLGGIFSFLRGCLYTLAGERIVARMRRELFCHLLRQDVSFFDKNKTGELMNRLSSDTTVIQSAVTVNISMGLRFAAQVIVGLCVIFLYSWKLSLVMLSIVPLISLTAVCYGRFVKRLSKSYQDALANGSETAQEVFSSVRTVRSFAGEARESARYVGAIDKSFRMGAQRAVAYGAFGGIIGTVGQYAVVLVLWYGGTLTLRGELDAGELTSFLLYTVFIAVALGGLSDLFGTVMNALGASDRVFALLDSTPAIPTSGGTVVEPLRGLLELQDVTFAYPSRPDVTVLDNVSLTVQPGTVLALCGPSGSGKSSVISLLERFYDPDRGRILVDGVPLTQVDPAWWRRSVALVAQEPVLFACSVRDNIGYGLWPEAATREAVEQAARTANAHDFVVGFPDAYDELVGERGVQLSGGQKQRIAIARALLMDPTVLLLDEATSALDAESEHVVQEAIDRLMSRRTTILVAHRLSTVRGADCICAVHKGRIVERGTHDELLQQRGMYFQLVKRQLGGSNAQSFDDGLDVVATPQ